MLKSLAIFLICLPFQISQAEPRINNIQMLGSHNSFKKFMDPLIKNTFELFCALSDIGAGDYEHRPLNEELDLGARGLELDVFADPNGNQFRQRKLLGYLGAGTDPHDANLTLPGFKVMHDPNFDFYSTCTLFTDCLKIILRWSQANPNHLPIILQIEVHNQTSPLPREMSDAQFAELDLNTIVKMTPQLFDDLDREIFNTIPRNKLIIPDDIRGNFATLSEAISTNGWPTVSSARGKFIFVFTQGADDNSMYLESHPTLSGRAMFVYTSANDINAAFIKRDDPTESDITSLVSQGFIVRTRTDMEGQQAMTGDTRSRDLALSSGAHIVSTDFLIPDPRFAPANYSVSIPSGNPARCNPVLPGDCTSSFIQE